MLAQGRGWLKPWMSTFMPPFSTLLRSAVLNVFALEISVWTPLNVILSSRIERRNEDALSGGNTKLQNNGRRRGGAAQKRVTNIENWRHAAEKDRGWSQFNHLCISSVWQNGWDQSVMLETIKSELLMDIKTHRGVLLLLLSEKHLRCACAGVRRGGGSDHVYLFWRAAWVWGSKVRMWFWVRLCFGCLFLFFFEPRCFGVIVRDGVVMDEHWFKPRHILSFSSLESTFVTGTWWEAAGEPRSWVLPLCSTDSPWQLHCYANLAN